MTGLQVNRWNFQGAPSRSRVTRNQSETAPSLKAARSQEKPVDVCLCSQADAKSEFAASDLVAHLMGHATLDAMRPDNKPTSEPTPKPQSGTSPGSQELIASVNNGTLTQLDW